MQRRDFSAKLSLSALGLATLGLPGMAQAQGGPAEGKQYLRLSQALPTTPGKIEVIEFFWYGCPHCYAFDPVLESWVKQLPADVSFRRVHVGFRANIKIHQRLFFALEAMGKEAEVHTAVFNAFQRNMPDDEKATIALAGSLGLDVAKFTAAYNSFGVQTKCAQATKLSEDYRIDGVPALGVAGKFLTSPAIAGTRGATEQVNGQQSLAVVDFLIKQLRNKG
ncbi:thiol:disulfide interchange protein DsbA/DsbL [Roseateles koreensis]|uniref:Thiol:disulfide interchange protein n=1 Tax=Roseateles koreensis TaxID=2987526 RepID=A0ABT5KTG6_9BURK|nr:thiol:disulfide interchange protein DsbA/DsbL [Roseateles koreensis]MDC8785735.1 thiol:disulfide interchange protein DsbA/DsbL [Roseateles koreensis]